MIQLLITLEPIEGGEQIRTQSTANISPIVALGLLEAAKQNVLNGGLQVIVPEVQAENVGDQPTADSEER
jgi:hypothetical protein